MKRNERFIPKDDATQAILDELREYFGVRTDEQVMQGAIALVALAKRFAVDGQLTICDNTPSGGGRLVNVDMWAERRRVPENAYTAVAESVKAAGASNVVPIRPETE